MLEQNDIQKIKEITASFFEKTSFDIDVEVLPFEDNTVPIKIKTQDPKILIGQNGKTLCDIQRLLKAILSRQIKDNFYIDIDVNDYKKNKIEYLKETAKDLADEVVLTGKEKDLGILSSYERRIIHMALANRSGIKTESVGQDPERKIIIKPL